MNDYQWQYTITPASAEIDAEEAAEATGQAFVQAAQVAGQSMSLPEMDPYSWGEIEPGQHEVARRLEITRTSRLRRERAEATRTSGSDIGVLSDSPLELYGEAPPERQLQHAKQFAQERQQRAAGIPQDPLRFPARGDRNRPDRWNQPPATQANLSPPAPLQPDTTTEIPQPPAWRDSPERRAGGPIGQSPQQQTFGMAQVSFDNAVARQMEGLARFVQDATRRIEELECWREAFVQE